METNATQPTASPATLKMQLSELQFSDKLTDFAASFVAAQGEIENAKKGRDNKFFDSKYAELSDVSDACRPALNKNGIAVIQTPIPSAEPMTLAIETRLLHKSGQWMRGTLSIPLLKRDPQGYGSTLTYARRYHLAAITGVCPEDDDGNAANGHDGDNNQRSQNNSRPPARQQQPPKQATQPKQTEPETAEVISTEKADEIREMLAQSKNPGAANEMALKKYSVKQIDDLTVAQAEDCIAWIEESKKKSAAKPTKKAA